MRTYKEIVKNYILILYKKLNEILCNDENMQGE